MNALLKDAEACNRRLALHTKEPPIETAYVVNKLAAEVARLQGQVAFLEARMRRVLGIRLRDMNAATLSAIEVHIPDVVAEAVEKAAAIHGVEPAEFFSSRKFRRIAWARFHVWHTLKNSEKAWPYPWIARRFGVDHTSVMHGVRQWGEHGERYLRDELGISVRQAD